MAASMLGAGLTLGALADDPAIAARLPALADAARAAAGPGHRSAATLGGNLCQDTRCVFYNQSEWWRASQQLLPQARRHHLPCRAAGRALPRRVQRRPGAGAAGAGRAGRAAVGARHALAAAGAAVPRRRRRPPHARAGRTAGRGCGCPRRRPALVCGYRKARVREAMDFPLAAVAVALRGRARPRRVARRSACRAPIRIRCCWRAPQALAGEAVDAELLAAASASWCSSRSARCAAP